MPKMVLVIHIIGIKSTRRYKIYYIINTRFDETEMYTTSKFGASSVNRKSNSIELPVSASVTDEARTFTYVPLKCVRQPNQT